MIYVDPPYGITFGSNFQPSIGDRDVKDREQDLTREPETVKAYRDTWTLGIHSYLAFLRERLLAARELLTDAGSIFVQISDENLHRVRCVMDEVFKPANFCALITIVKTAGQSTQLVASVCDYLLWYARDISKVKFRQTYRPKQSDNNDVGHYSWIVEANGNRRAMRAFEKEDPRKVHETASFYAPTSLISQGASKSGFRKFTFQAKQYDCGQGQHWKTNEVGLRRLADAERIHVAENSIRFVRFLDDFPAIPHNNFWDDTATGNFTESKIYVVQTNTKIIERCLLMTTDAGDLALDPTCGSGTTAYVAEKWGRRWITCDSSRVALALAKHRIMTAEFDYHQLRPVDAEDLSRNPNGSWLTDPDNKISGNVTLQCRSVSHITLKSIARNTSLDPIFAKHKQVLEEKLEILNSEVTKVGAALKESLVEKLIHKHREFGANSISSADTRRWLLPDTQPSLIKPIPARKPLKGVTAKQAEGYRSQVPKDVWKEWEVPFDFDADWPKPLQDAITAYRSAWREKMDEVNGCIQVNAEMEELVDKPEPVRGVLRVSGPFTVEGVRPEEMNLGDGGLFAGSPNEEETEGKGNLGASNQQNLQAYLDQMVQLIRKDGLTFLNNKRRTFAQVDSLFDAGTGAVLHAEGSWDDSATPDLLEVAIGFGPQYGPVTALQVEELIHASKRHNELVVAGFSFDADATALIQEQSHPRLRIHQAYIRPDVNPGMAGLLKETPDSQLFTVFGTPEIEIKPHEDSSWVVNLKGVEVYDPVANRISSTGADKVAAWFLDSDFDGRCFCITQAFFPNQDSWEKIAKALGSAANSDAFEAFKGTTSIPFPSGKFKRVAVKVIDPRGNEVMAVRVLEG
jgi:adenine-specific DNA-methyltransferase